MKPIIFLIAGFIQGLLFFLILFVEATVGSEASWLYAILLTSGKIVTFIFSFIFLIIAQKKLNLSMLKSILYPLLFWAISCVSMMLFTTIWREIHLHTTMEQMAPVWGLLVVYTLIYMHIFSMIVIVISVFVKWFRDKKLK